MCIRDRDDPDPLVFKDLTFSMPIKTHKTSSPANPGPSTSPDAPTFDPAILGPSTTPNRLSENITPEHMRPYPKAGDRKQSKKGNIKRKE